MGKLFRAIVSEHRKLWQKKSVWLCLAALAALSVGCVLLCGELCESGVKVPVLASSAYGEYLFGGGSSFVAPAPEHPDVPEPQPEQQPEPAGEPVVSGATVSVTDIVPGYLKKPTPSGSDAAAAQTQPEETAPAAASAPPATDQEVEAARYADAAAEQLRALNTELSAAETAAQRADVKARMAKLTRDAAVAVYRARYEVPAGEDENGWRLLILAVWLMTPLAAAVSVLFASDMFAGEFTRGTICMILPRPITRIKQYAAKLITALLFSMLAMWVVYLAVLLASGSLSGSDVYVGFLNDSVYRTTWAKHSLVMLLCNYITVFVCVALCAMVGNMTRSRGASIVAALGLLLIALLGGGVLGSSGADILGWTLPACLDLGAVLESVPYAPEMGFSQCAMSAGAHLAVFVMLGYSFFRRDAR